MIGCLQPPAATDKPGSLFAESASGLSNVHFVTVGVSESTDTIQYPFTIKLLI
jgi:hypothetical protein